MHMTRVLSDTCTITFECKCPPPPPPRYMYTLKSHIQSFITNLLHWTHFHGHMALHYTGVAPFYANQKLCLRSSNYAGQKFPLHTPTYHQICFCWCFIYNKPQCYIEHIFAVTLHFVTLELHCFTLHVTRRHA